MINAVLIIVIILIIVLLFYLSFFLKNEAIYLKSDLDNKKYMVQNLEDREEAAHMLSVISERILILKEYLQKNKDK